MKTKTSVISILVLLSSVFTGIILLKQLFPGNDYYEYEINSSILKIIKYDRGTPKVLLRNGKTMLLYINGEGKLYVKENDSISKKPKTNAVTVYRFFKNKTIVSVYGSTRNGTGLQRRYYK